MAKKRSRKKPQTTKPKEDVRRPKPAQESSKIDQLKQKYNNLPPFTKLLIISGTVFAVLIYIILRIAFKPDPFQGDLKGSDTINIQSIPSAFPTGSHLKLPDSTL